MKNRMVCLFLVITLIWPFAATVYGQCNVIQQGVFAPQQKRVRLVSRHGAPAHKVIVFRTSLRVNTDGAPNSYHPEDLSGTVKALNSICNGISVKRNGKKLSCSNAIPVIRQYIRNNFREPAGTSITWHNVIAPTTDATGRRIPCVFQTGEFAGYFGSLTSLKHDLTGQAAGECEHLNQLDQRIIPAFVLPEGQNILRTLGAGKGDLLVAFNPANNVVSVAVIGDIGPPEKLGEGSVGLNMILLGKTKQPTTYDLAKMLDTGNKAMLIGIIPNSRTFNPRRPFTKENLTDRVDQWLAQAGFSNQQNFVDFLKNCSN